MSFCSDEKQKKKRKKKIDLNLIYIHFIIYFDHYFMPQ